MKAKTAADQFQLIPESMMPFNLAGEILPAEPPPPPIPEHTNETTANLFQELPEHLPITEVTAA